MANLTNEQKNIIQEITKQYGQVLLGSIEEADNSESKFGLNESDEELERNIKEWLKRSERRGVKRG